MLWPFTKFGSSKDVKQPDSWSDSLKGIDWAHFRDYRNWVPGVLLTTTVLASLQIYRTRLRRIPGAIYVRPGSFRKRTVFGKVTSVGDGDNFHLFHTPGGIALGWGWLRKIPDKKVDLRSKTIPIRLAGVDAPEGAHFGRPAQPYSTEALNWLSGYILGRRVRARIYKRDQYDRIVGTVFVRRFLLRKDVGLEMIKKGLATTYEAKSGAEFGGLEEKYKRAQEKAKAQKLGMWAGKPKFFESPRDYKTRIAIQEALQNKKGKP